MNEEFEQLRNAVGGLAELCVMFYEDCLAHTDEDIAITLTINMLQCLLRRDARDPQ